jgi:AraC-like DNA-binding protein
VTLSRLHELVERHAHRADLGVALPGVSIVASPDATGPMPATCDTSVAVVVQGRKRSVVGTEVFEYGPGQYFVAPVELPITFQIVRAPFYAVALELRPAAIAELLLEDAVPRDVPRVAVSDASDDLLDPLVRLLRLADRPQDVPVLRPAVEREILWRLLTGEQAELVRQIGLSDSRLARIAKVVKWIREHYAEPFRIEDLARMADMGLTSFHRHFRAVTTMSPVRYRQRIRLQEARIRLLAEADDVAGVGFAVGYESPSQFSREYRRLFGEPPGRDALRLLPDRSGLRSLE